MSGRGGRQKESGLGSLPAGRHGLSREFVTRNQRERLTAGTIAAVAERGFREAGVTAISAAAGVSRRTFYSYFKDKEECFLSTYDLFEKHLFENLGEGPKGGSWPSRVRWRVERLLEFLAANPDLVRFSLSAPPSAGGELDERARTFLEGLVSVLSDGHPGDAGEVERGAMAGMISAILIDGVEGNGSLENVAPTLTETVLAPFIGRSKAITEASKSGSG